MSEETTTEGPTDAVLSEQPAADSQPQAGDQTQSVADGAAGTEAAKVEPEGAAPAAKPAKKGKATVRTEVKKPVVDVVTAETTTKTDVEDTEVDELPAKITLAAPYAFYDDEGKLQSWLEGSVVEDADTISLLIDRGVILKAE
jgi:hypothetical protein